MAEITSKVIIREREKKDIDLVNELFSRLTTLKRDKLFYQWIYSIWGEGCGIVAECDGKIVGHYGATSREMVVDGQAYKSFLGLHAVVDPEYRNSVSIFDLTFELYSKLKARNVDFIFGFPNVNYRLIQEKVEKWKCISLFNAMELKSKNFSSVSDFSGNLVDLSLLHLDLEYFDKEFVAEKLNYLRRDNYYYLRRYVNHPQETYYKWNWKLGETNQILFIYKVYIKENQRHCQILEILGNAVELKESIETFISKMSPYLHYFTFWPFSKDVKEVLISLGFTQTSFDTFFGCKPLSERAKVLVKSDKLSNFDNWFLTMGDSDVF